MNFSGMSAAMQAYFARVKAKFAETLSAAKSHADTRASQAESGANAYTDSRIGNHNHDDRYYTKSQVDSRIAANSGNRARYVDSTTLEIEINGYWYEIPRKQASDPGGGGSEA